MSHRWCSLIVAVPGLNPDLPVFRTLASCKLDANEYQVLAAVGCNPPAQRNAALKKAEGEVTVFLDSDCEVDPEYFRKIREWKDSGATGVIGGPVLLRHGGTEMESAVQALFSNRWVTGPSCARYAAFGEKRHSSEKELILCNLAARKDLFDKVGGFDERLFPNEENEWLDRVKTAGEEIVHDPALPVRRPQRKTWGEVLATFFRYGTGRGRQSVLSQRWDPGRFLPSVFVLLVLFLLVQGKWGWVFQAGLLHFLLIGYEGLKKEEEKPLMVALVGPLAVAAYGVGEWWGMIDGIMSPVAQGSLPVEVVEISNFRVGAVCPEVRSYP